MGLFSKRSDGAVTVTAMVAAAGPPPQNKLARHYADWVFVVADLGQGPAYLRSVVDLDRERWLVAGTQVEITIDPKDVHKIHAFTLNWDKVPTIAERVAANDRTLADPIQVRQEVLKLRDGATDLAPAPTSLIYKMDQPLYGVGENTIAPSSGMGLKVASWLPYYEQALEHAKTAPAPAGKRRGVAVITAMRMVFRNIGHHTDGSPDLQGNPGENSFEAAMTGNETVFAIYVPGQAPYAVFDGAFKARHGKPVTSIPALYHYLPVAVSLTDPHDVEVLWDEVLEELAQVTQRTPYTQTSDDPKIQAVQDMRTQAINSTFGDTSSMISAMMDKKSRGSAIASMMGAMQQNYQAQMAPGTPFAATMSAAYDEWIVEASQRYHSLPADEAATLLGQIRESISTKDPTTAAHLRDGFQSHGLDV